MCFIYFTATSANFGLLFFLPQIVRSQGFTITESGLISSLPYVVSCAGMVVIGNLSDRFKKRKFFVVLSMVFVDAGLLLAGWLGESPLSIGAICVSVVGIMGMAGPFWALPASRLRGIALAVGIPLVSSVGNLGGFTGPYIVGWAQRATGHFAGSLIILAGLATLGVVVALVGIPADPLDEESALAKMSFD